MTIDFSRLHTDLFHGVAEGGNDQRKRFNQADDTAGSNRTCTDVFDIIGPDGNRAHFRDRHGSRINRRSHAGSEEGDERHDDEPGQDTACHHIGGNLRTADVADTKEGGQNVRTEAGTLIAFKVPGDFTGKELETVRNEFIDGGDSHTGEDGDCLGAAGFACL